MASTEPDPVPETAGVAAGPAVDDIDEVTPAVRAAS